MKEITVNGTEQKAIVDDELYDLIIAQGPWRLHNNGNVIRGGAYSMTLAWFVLGKPVELEIDHIDRNKFNNQKSNLRYATRSQNAANRGKQSNNTSGFKGVNWHTYRQKWRANIKVKGKQIHLGLFTTPGEAATKYDKAAKEYFGQFASLNFPDS